MSDRLARRRLDTSLSLKMQSLHTALQSMPRAHAQSGPETLHKI